MGFAACGGCSLCWDCGVWKLHGVGSLWVGVAVDFNAVCEGLVVYELVCVDTVCWVF